MNLKNILLDLDAAIKTRWGAEENCPCLSEIGFHISELDSIKHRLKLEKKAKQEIASKFKLFKSQPEQITDLKAEMQKISTQLSVLEDKRKAIETELLTLFKEEEKPTFPSRFKVVNNTEKNESNYEITEDVQQAEWNEYVDAHPMSSAYHDFKWKTVIEESFNHTCKYLAARSNNKIVGIFPLVAFKHPIFGTFAISMPYLNYGGPLTNHPEITSVLIDYAQKLQQDFNWEHIELRTTCNSFSYPSESRKASMILTLPPTMDQLEDELGAKVRAQYKLADKHSPAIFFGKEELLDDYYRVFSKNMRDLGTPVYSKDFFRNILKLFPDQATIVVAKIKGKAMGTAFLFSYKDMLEIPWASTLKKANSYNLNMWMYKNILAFAIDSKHDYFDFGRSTLNAGTYKFKKQWGAQPLQHYWYYLLEEGEELPQINPDNPKFKLAITIWKRLPVFLTNLIGPSIVKHIP